MRHIKSERLKKLEKELEDLQQWLKLGLVPKKDVEKHREEIQAVEGKIQEEKERIQFLKESGDIEEYVAPKRSQQRTAFTDMPSIPDIDGAENSSASLEGNFENENTETDNSVIEDGDDTEEKTVSEDTHVDDSYFGEKNRWKRIIDPDADEW